MFFPGSALPGPSIMPIFTNFVGSINYSMMKTQHGKYPLGGRKDLGINYSMMKTQLPFLLLFLFSFLSASGQKNSTNDVYLTQNGQVYFHSDAPLEFIGAKSDLLEGVIDPAKNTFAFQLEISSFEGFNSPLQKVHFNENYLETKRFPKATFSGKIIEKVDLKKDGTYTVRTKGKLVVHGISQERIIKSTVTVTDGVLELKSTFTVLLDEHDIDIPRIVHQKIAEEIKVEITAVLN